ncbi:MAG: hypothetical protein ACRDRS_19235 [Pseudonocardiaceae bacterium]
MPPVVVAVVTPPVAVMVTPIITVTAMMMMTVIIIIIAAVEVICEDAGDPHVRIPFSGCFPSCLLQYSGRPAAGRHLQELSSTYRR